MITLCPQCATVVRVVGDPTQIDSLVGCDSQFWPSGYFCPNCGGGAVGVTGDRVSPEMLMGRPGEQLFELTPEEAFALHMGLGMPQERTCTERSLDEALKEGVTSWGLETDQMSGRVYIKWIGTSKGTRLCLGAGPCGAVVFRIRPAQRYSERVQDGATGS